MLADFAFLLPAATTRSEMRSSERAVRRMAQILAMRIRASKRLDPVPNRTGYTVEVPGVGTPR